MQWGSFMKKQLLLSLLLSSTFILSGYKPVKQYTIKQFMDTVSYRGASFSPDEDQLLFSSNQSGIYNAYSIPIGGGAPTQLTHSTTNAIYSISYFPNDKRFLYSSDKGGNELSHIWVHNPDGTSQELTTGKREKAYFFGWNRNGRSFYYLSNKRNPKYMDAYEMNLTTYKPKLIYQNDTGYDLEAISADQRYFALQKSHTRDDSDIYLYDSQRKQMKHITHHQGSVRFSPSTFSLNNQYLYYKSDQGSEFSFINRYHIPSGTIKNIARADWDIMNIFFSHNERYRAVGINQDASTVIKAWDNRTNQPIALPQVAGQTISSIYLSKSENKMAFYSRSSSSPANLFSYDLNTRKVRQLTTSLNPQIEPDDLVDAQVVRYPSFDGLKIPSILYKPHHLKPGEKAPAILWIHGGPGGQTRVAYYPVIQYLVNHGYVVLAVNNRGSSGYGKTFFGLDDRKHGDHDLMDCVKAKDFLKATGYVYENKIGIMGGSYGGYMVLAALAYQPQEFNVGVDIFGVSNWVRTLKSIPPWWESFRKSLYKELGDPAVDLDYLKKISPLFHAHNIVKPLMVLQGANDPRVLKAESDEIVAAVKKNGVPVEYVVFPDEGHGFVKRSNQIKGYEAVLRFLDRHLK